MSQFKQVLLKITIIFLHFTTFAESVLLYPASTIFQITGSLSLPITDLPAKRKVFFDWGFQMNYDMPFNVSSFYMVPIWATNQNRISKREVMTNVINTKDFTAKELYEGLENILERYGYDRSCLKRSICELARHPFDETYQNLATDIITFVLTPSLNQGFSADEKYEQSVFSLAEDRGFLGQNCQHFYPQCIDEFFNIFTIIHTK